MKIYNYSNKISKNQIEKVISLLPKEYTNINIPVFVFGNKTVHNIINFIFTHNFEDYDGCAGYMSYSDYTPTRIVMHNKNNKLTLIYNLFHEYRHAYQAIYMEDMFQKVTKGYIDCGIGNDEAYDAQVVEIDANRFAYNMIKVHRKEICDILNIYYESPKFPKSKIYVNKYKEL